MAAQPAGHSACVGVPQSAGPQAGRHRGGHRCAHRARWPARGARSSAGTRLRHAASREAVGPARRGLAAALAMAARAGGPGCRGRRATAATPGVATRCLAGQRPQQARRHGPEARAAGTAVGWHSRRAGRPLQPYQPSGTVMGPGRASAAGPGGPAAGAVPEPHACAWGRAGWRGPRWPLRGSSRVRTGGWRRPAASWPARLGQPCPGAGGSGRSRRAAVASRRYGPAARQR